MCYHVSTAEKAKFDAYAENNGYKVEGYQHYYLANAFSHPPVPITTNVNTKRVYTGVWGFVPDDAVNPQQAKSYADSSLNAKSEWLFSPTGKYYEYTANRCLIWVDGFFESQHRKYRIQGKGKRMKNDLVKVPHYIYMPGHEPFTMAGIYNNWRAPGNDHAFTYFSLITTAANERMREIHNNPDNPHRMPLIIAPEDRQHWLTCDTDNMREIMKPFPDGILQDHTVSLDKNFEQKDRNYPYIQQPEQYPEWPQTEETKTLF